MARHRGNQNPVLQAMEELGGEVKLTDLGLLLGLSTHAIHNRADYLIKKGKLVKVRTGVVKLSSREAIQEPPKEDLQKFIMGELTKVAQSIIRFMTSAQDREREAIYEKARKEAISQVLGKLAELESPSPSRPTVKPARAKPEPPVVKPQPTEEVEAVEPPVVPIIHPMVAGEAGKKKPGIKLPGSLDHSLMVKTFESMADLGVTIKEVKNHWHVTKPGEGGTDGFVFPLKKSQLVTTLLKDKTERLGQGLWDVFSEKYLALSYGNGHGLGGKDAF